MSYFIIGEKTMDGYRIDNCDSCPYLGLVGLMPNNPYFCKYYDKSINIDILRKKPGYCKVVAFYIELKEE